MSCSTKVSFKHEEQNSRLWAFLTLVGIKNLALIPHMIALFFMQIAASVVMIIGVFAVLFTGKYPKGMQEFIVGVMRWQWKIMSYYVCMSAKYPPFTKNSGDYPADLQVEHQERSSRLMALLTLIPIKYIMLIPHIVVFYVLELITAVCIFLGFFLTLFTGKYPMFAEKWVLRLMNYGLRIGAYFMCMTDKYPKVGWGCCGGDCESEGGGSQEKI
ncbi:MAG: DUF4389 domain-containing protein [bacterium]|nr:DUF4389 domain-containing protein [bacterium]